MLSDLLLSPASGAQAERRTLRAALPARRRVHARCAGVAIAAGALMASVSLAGHAPAAAVAAKGCLRGGATLVAADRAVRVVRVRERPTRGATRVDRMLGCWVATGRRFTLFRERDFGADERQTTEWEIVDGRFVGARRTATGGVSFTTSAENFDVRARRRLAVSSRCDHFSSGDAKGIQDVVFLTRGAMAYACGELWLQSPTKGSAQLEPAGTDVRHLAASRNSTESPLLYWTVVSGGESIVKTMPFLG